MDGVHGEGTEISNLLRVVYCDSENRLKSLVTLLGLVVKLNEDSYNVKEI